MSVVVSCGCSLFLFQLPMLSCVRCLLVCFVIVMLICVGVFISVCVCSLHVYVYVYVSFTLLCIKFLFMFMFSVHAPAHVSFVCFMLPFST